MKNSLIEKLWEKNQMLEAENKVLKGKTSDNVKKTKKRIISQQKLKPENHVGNNGRSLEPTPSQTVIARAKTCLHSI